MLSDGARGTEFVVTAAAAALNVTTMQGRVLIVDDEKALLLALKGLLVEGGLRGRDRRQRRGRGAR